MAAAMVANLGPGCGVMRAVVLVMRAHRVIMPVLGAGRVLAAPGVMRRISAALPDIRHAYRLMVRIAIVEPARVGRAHAAFVELDAIIVAAIAAGAIFARAVAIGEIGIFVVAVVAVVTVVAIIAATIVIVAVAVGITDRFGVGLVIFGVGGADQNHGGEGG